MGAVLPPYLVSSKKAHTFVVSKRKELWCIRGCGVEQLVARWAHNPEVAGSSPAPATEKEERDVVVPKGIAAFFLSAFSYRFSSIEGVQ